MIERSLKLFRTAAAVCNFTEVAAMSGMTQPNVTKQIANLERSLGVRLFQRTGRNVRLTPAGEVLRVSLGEGDVERAGAMLGYPYPLGGIVVEGNRLGRTLGFPTANIQPSDPLKLVPSNGVYLTQVHTLGQDFYGMTNIGTRPTVSGVTEGEALSRKVRTVETHIFDFDEEIYGLDIRIEFLQRIRDERRFASLAELQRQLAADRETCLGLI